MTVQLPLSLSRREALEVARHAAEEAGSLLLKHASGQLELGYKEGRANLVTDVDVLAEKCVIGILREEYPDFNIISEESPAILHDSQFTWIIDPLDGTNNYVHGVPFFCVAIALMRDEELVLGLTYDPVRRELFAAERGRGASLCELPMHVADRTSLRESFLGCDLGYDGEKGRAMLNNLSVYFPGMGGLRLIGSAALGLTYVACGRLDGYVHPYLYPWDVSAGVVLVQEAGGKITDWEGQPATADTKEVVASNESLHSDFLKIVQERQQLHLGGL